MKSVLPVLSALLFLLSCKQESQQQSDNAYRGEILVMADHDFAPIIAQEANAYSIKQPDARIRVIPSSEDSCFLSLNDTSRVIIVGREPRPDEEEIYKSRMLSPVVRTVALDGVVLLVSPQSKLENLSLESLKEMLDKNPGGHSFVFDNSRSGIFSYITQKTGVTPKTGVYAVTGIDQLIDHVVKNDKAIGFAPYSWFGDGEDSLALQRLARVKFVNIARTDSTGTVLEYSRPEMSTLANGKYPLFRPVYAITLEARSGLGNAFIGYMASQKGQAVFRLAGLCPYYKMGFIKEIVTK